jgi:hypothetical protein
MNKAKGNAFTVLTFFIALLASIASFAGLFMKGLYKDNDLVISAWQGKDIVTLFVVVPMMLVALFYLNRDSSKAKLFWMGSLWYMFYNYMFYMFGATFNTSFLLYVGLVILSIYTLIFALIRTDPKELSQRFRIKTPVKWISGFMLTFAVLLGGMWTILSLSFIFTGQVHQSIAQTGHQTAVVFAVDLTLLIPPLVLAGILLWKKNPWGFVLSTIVLIKATAYGLVLIIMSIVSYFKIGIIDPFILLWFILTLGCIVCLGLLIGNMKNDEATIWVK